MDNKTILVTGATSGIGKAIAYRFAQGGYRTIITGRRGGRLQELQQELSQISAAGCLAIELDVRDKASVQAMLETLQSGNEQLDILVNNAGLAVGLAGIHEGELDDWDRMLDTNVRGLLYVTRAVVPLMTARSKGHVINIGSISGHNVYKNGAVYCGTKFAVDALSQGMRIDLLPYSIKVTAINPGAVETEFSLVRYKGDEPRAKAMYDGYQPLTAEDVADTAWYAANLPPHVCINDITMTCITQANSFYNIKSNEIAKSM